ncbi:DEAD/DEAH box helicase [Tsukamurella paurometabola]|uniref:ATP-dependent helicase HepA n=1 Tax=Tsukamurella paurometabola TaxID=2061 RepID=A0A3P8LGI4_TSUPA|nr:DEAD/DEAH box helicase [Tsukamurella paurometabola]MBS4100935.1 DEAD/DEAH box helicase [Tsukamurella paurometabola]UEA83365.1 DEAD/DEAH box helicase [Tsukamurella paurometabola]VDR40472.1 ATP-dependent helicase HepA [Tsukamurella paurometabola]
MLPLAVPVDGALTVTDVRCDIVDVTALPGGTRPSASLAAWTARSRGEDAPLPIAAHAEPDPTGTAVTSAAYAAAAFADTVATATSLGGALDAKPRPYQAAGVAWLLRTLRDHGGALLADEMGLGKTLQAIAALTRLGPGPYLVVCPTSLATNWRREIARFAPALLDEVTIVTYARLRLSAAELAATRWTAVVFDEAHTLKNPRTQVSRAARELNTDFRIALTGTPIENSLDDLWAILRVVAPRMFPVKAVFRRRFTRAVESGDDGALRRLRAAVAPVMLARTKDRAAGALPPKIDNPVLCDLSDDQARHYDAVLARAADDGFGSGLERHGRLLAVLTTLKQICNHPGLVDGAASWEPGRSGKLDVALEILEANAAAHRPTLVFTQYRETGEMLAAAASSVLGRPVPFFHGGLSLAERSSIADDFQSGTGPEILVMSLKAGGTGLTLTRASEVIHYDRWWNPAVEAQATDRAHRIGQDRPVTVTTLTTATTIEEHIDEMHRRKALLGVHADDGSIVTELAALDDERLMDVLRRNREN